jgi:hypothetical protein
MVRLLPSPQTKGGHVPSPLFNFLFLVAFFVPIGMYVVGVLILMASVITRHWTLRHNVNHPIVATAH